MPSPYRRTGSAPVRIAERHVVDAAVVWRATPRCPDHAESLSYCDRCSLEEAAEELLTDALAALEATVRRRDACETCGMPSVGRSLDDVPLCERCGRALEIR